MKNEKGTATINYSAMLFANNRRTLAEKNFPFLTEFLNLGSASGFSLTKGLRSKH